MRIFIILLLLLSGSGAAATLFGQSGLAERIASFAPFYAIAALLALLLSLLNTRFLLAAAAGIVFGIACLPLVQEWQAGRAEARYNSVAGPGPGPVITITTHNLAARNVAPQQTLQALIDSDSDILLLQEADGTMANLLPQLEKRYPWHSKCRDICDLAIYSRLPLTPVQWKFRDVRGERIGPPLMWARIIMEGREIPLVTVHLPWPSEEQSEWRAELSNLLTPLAGQQLLLAGDFNLTPWGRGMAGFEEAIMPVRRVTHAQFSFPAHVGTMRWPVPVLPIDHIFAGPAWQVVSLERLEITGSDHRPLKVTLRLTDQMK